MTTFRRLSVCLVLASSLQAGILVTRVPQGFQFVEAASVCLHAAKRSNGNCVVGETDDRADVEVALLLCHWFRTAVLG